MDFVYREAVVESYLIGLSGPLNLTRSESVVRLFRDLAERGIRRVMIDMGNVPLIDSRGLAALLAGYKIFGGVAANFQLTAIQDQPRLVLELTGFDLVFRTDDDPGNGVREAIALDWRGQHLSGYNSPLDVSKFAVPDLVA
jgi:anti-anti-sigma factor